MIAPWSDDARAEELLDLLAGAITEHGAEGFLRHGVELLEPDQRFFPDRWEWSLVGVARLLQRLLRYAGLEDRRLQIEDGRVPLDDVLDAKTQQPLIDFISADNDRLVFQLELLGPPDLVLGALCYEVARAFAAVRRTQHPYRDGGRDNPMDHLSEEARVKAAALTIYLGFGPISVNAAHTFRQSGEIVGREAITHRAHIFVGALPSGDLGFLLAAQLAALGQSAEAEAILRQLSANQAQGVRSWLAQLARHPEALRQRLGLPALEAWPRPQPRDPGPGLDAETEAELKAADEAYQNPLRGEQVPRYYEGKAVSYLMIGALIGVVPFVFMLLEEQLRWLCWLPLALPAGIGALVGSRRRIEYCGGCNMLLRAREASCRKCGAALGAPEPLTDARRTGSDDEDDEDDELTRQALEAEGGSANDEHGEV